MIIYRFELPYPPSINSYWRNIGTRTILSRQGRSYRQSVRQSIAAIFGGKPPIMTCPLSASIAIYPPDLRRRDIDNVLKAILDALQYAGVYADDYQFQLIQIKRCGVVVKGKAVVTITEYTSNGSEV